MCIRDRIKKDAVKLFVDVNGLSRGTHSLNIQYEISGEFQPVSVVITPANMTVTIT